MITIVMSERGEAGQGWLPLDKVLQWGSPLAPSVFTPYKLLVFLDSNTSF